MKNNAERNFKSNKAMHDMTRVLSDGGFICIPGSKRPTTAVVGPSLTQAHGLGRRRMASNSILNANARNRSSNRRFMYNKESYQTNGALSRVTSTVKAEMEGRANNMVRTSLMNQEGETREQSPTGMLDQNFIVDGADVAGNLTHIANDS